MTIAISQHLCRCGHTRESHLDGVCICESNGDICECSRFRRKGTRAKRGTAKRDVLDQWHRSASQPVNEDDGPQSIADMTGEEDVGLVELLGEKTVIQEFLDSTEQLAKERYAVGRCKRKSRPNVQRDIEIYDRNKAGESQSSLAREFGLSQSSIFVIINTMKSHLLHVMLKHEPPRRQR